LQRQHRVELLGVNSKISQQKFKGIRENIFLRALTVELGKLLKRQKSLSTVPLKFKVMGFITL
jgi:hypothetical protein